MSPALVLLGGDPAMDFLNTRYVSGAGPVDVLTTWADVVRWLAATGGPAGAAVPAGAQAAALREVRTLREEWLAEYDRRRAGERVSAAFLARLNALLEAAPGCDQAVTDAEGRLTLERRAVAGPGAAQALAAIARHIAQFLVHSEPAYWRRCANPECVLRFYDTTKNHRRLWCSALTCGNRHKVAEFRRRTAERSNG